MFSEVPGRRGFQKGRGRWGGEKKEKNDAQSAQSSIGETLCESGRCIDGLKKRRRVPKKRGRVPKKRGRSLFSKENRRWAASSRRGGWLLKKGEVVS